MTNSELSPSMQFIVAMLESDKDVSYADVHAAAEQNSFTVYPVLYGRAKKLLGLVGNRSTGVGPTGKKRAAAVQQGAPKSASDSSSRSTPGRWGDAAYTQIVAEHPEIEHKPESVALATWALKRNPTLDPEGFRTLSAQTGVQVRGRAIGSAREVLGLQSKAPKKVKSTSARQVRTAASPLEDVLSAIRTVERERDEAVAILLQLRELVDGSR